jgi:hypothetical protein
MSRKQSYIKGTFTHRRTEADYSSGSSVQRSNAGVRLADRVSSTLGPK